MKAILLIGLLSGPWVYGADTKNCQFSRALSADEESLVQALGCKSSNNKPSPSRIPLEPKILQAIRKNEALALDKFSKLPTTLLRIHVEIKKLRGLETTRPRAIPLVLEWLDNQNINFEESLVFRSAVLACTDGMESELNTGALLSLALSDAKKFILKLSQEAEQIVELSHLGGCSKALMSPDRMIDAVLESLWAYSDNKTERPALRGGWLEARSQIPVELKANLKIWKRLQDPGR